MGETRLHLRWKGELPPATSIHDVRKLTEGDTPQLAELMIAAYRGTIDYEGETDADAEQEIARTFSGAYGPLVTESSLGVWIDQSLQSAVIVSRFEDEPFFVFCMTKYEAKQKGYCRTLMLQSLAALLESGSKTAHLYVTAANEPAVNLYKKLGFAEA